MEFRERATKLRTDLKANWGTYIFMAAIIGFSLWQLGHPVVKTFYEWKLNELEAERSALKRDLEDARSKLKDREKSESIADKTRSTGGKLPLSKSPSANAVLSKPSQDGASNKLTETQIAQIGINKSGIDSMRSACEAYIAAGSKIQSAVMAVTKGSSTEKSVFIITNSALTKLRAEIARLEMKAEISDSVVELEGVWDALAEIDAKTMRLCDKRQTNFLSSVTKAIDESSRLQCVQLKTILANLLGLKEQADAETFFTDKSHLVVLFNSILDEGKSMFPRDEFISSFPRARVQYLHFDTRRLLLVSADSLKTRLDGHSAECASNAKQ
jgi:hypothetical protein